ncbi:hypothetical protein GCM10009682_15810 [Luedemannella flava]|uniref:Uncharacterized protein n=1 Tax=Luedemannella flava TaxID=349316 RepID=A0ABP4Y062_9ACTN
MTVAATRRARLITLFPLDTACVTAPPIDAASEVEIFGFAPRAGDSEGAETPWRPRVTDARRSDFSSRLGVADTLRLRQGSAQIA